MVRNNKVMGLFRERLMNNVNGISGFATSLIRRGVVFTVPLVMIFLWFCCCARWYYHVQRGPFRSLSRDCGLPPSRGSVDFKVVTDSMPWKRMAALAARDGPSVDVHAFGMNFKIPPVGGTLQIGWPAAIKFPQYPGKIQVTWEGSVGSWPVHAIYHGRKAHWLVRDHLVYVALPTSPGVLKISGTGDPVPPRFYAVAERTPHSYTVVTGAWPSVSPPWGLLDKRVLRLRQDRMTEILERSGAAPWAARSVAAKAVRVAGRMSQENLLKTAIGLGPHPGPGIRALRVAAILLAFPRLNPYFSDMVRCSGPAGNLYIYKLNDRSDMMNAQSGGYDDWRWVFFANNGRCLSFGDVSCVTGTSELRAVGKVAALAGFANGAPAPLPAPWGAGIPPGSHYYFFF